MKTQTALADIVKFDNSVLNSNFKPNLDILTLKNPECISKIKNKKIIYHLLKSYIHSINFNNNYRLIVDKSSGKMRTFEVNKLLKQDILNFDLKSYTI